MQGAMVASGEAIVFIDSLSEMNVDWLSPLLHRLSEVLALLKMCLFLFCFGIFKLKI